MYGGDRSEVLCQNQMDKGHCRTKAPADASHSEHLLTLVHHRDYTSILRPVRVAVLLFILNQGL